MYTSRLCTYQAILPNIIDMLMTFLLSMCCKAHTSYIYAYTPMHKEKEWGKKFTFVAHATI